MKTKLILTTIFYMMVSFSANAGTGDIGSSTGEEVNINQTYKRLSELLGQYSVNGVAQGRTAVGKFCQVTISLGETERGPNIDIEVTHPAKKSATYFSPGEWQSFEGATAILATTKIAEQKNGVKFTSLERNWDVKLWTYQELEVQSASRNRLKIQAATGLGFSGEQASDPNRIVKSDACYFRAL